MIWKVIIKWSYYSLNKITHAAKITNNKTYGISKDIIQTNSHIV